MRYSEWRQRRGVTLIELIVAIAVLSIMLAVTTLSFANRNRPTVAPLTVSAQVSALRSNAVFSGVPRTSTLRGSTGAILVTALPDGRVVSDLPNLDRIAGAFRNESAR
jgi:prepilin-type N-terminal cleavage/methylation domain-containing protein